jgi:arabinogalactan oligomer/maltooligosaccharide transport system substrate-binding protein
MLKLSKMFAACLVLVLMVSTLTGCFGGRGAEIPEKPDKLVVWEVEDQIANARKLAALFTAEYGIEVEVLPVPNLEQREKLMLDGPAGIGADVVTWPHDQVGTSVLAGIIQPITEWLAEGTLAGFHQSALDALSYGNELYGLPKAVETTALVYNKDLIATPPTTWVELIALAQQHTNAADNRFGLLFDYRNYYFVHGFFAAAGDYYIFKDVDGVLDTNDVGVNRAGGLTAINLLKDLVERDLIPVSADYGVMDDQFAQGRTAMIINGPWSINNYKERGINVGVAPLPTLPNGRNPNSFSGIKGWYLSAFTDHPYWATKLIEFMTSRESLESRFADTGEIPPRNDVEIDDPIITGFLAQAEFAQAMPNVAEMEVVWGNMGDAINFVATGQLAPQAALDQAKQFILDAIQERFR